MPRRLDRDCFRRRTREDGRRRKQEFEGDTAQSCQLSNLTGNVTQTQKQELVIRYMVGLHWRLGVKTDWMIIYGVTWVLELRRDVVLDN